MILPANREINQQRDQSPMINQNRNTTPNANYYRTSNNPAFVIQEKRPFIP